MYVCVCETERESEREGDIPVINYEDMNPESINDWESQADKTF